MRLCARPSLWALGPAGQILLSSLALRSRPQQGCGCESDRRSLMGSPTHTLGAVLRNIEGFPEAHFPPLCRSAFFVISVSFTTFAIMSHDLSFFISHSPPFSSFPPHCCIALPFAAGGWQSTLGVSSTPTPCTTPSSAFATAYETTTHSPASDRPTPTPSASS